MHRFAIHHRDHPHHFLLQDLGIISLSIFIAIILVRTDALVSILTSSQNLGLLGSFIAGLFFTSVFTTAPAIVTLGEIAQVNSLAGVALFGGLGAVVGDLIIFQFVRERFSEHLMGLMENNTHKKRLKSLFKLKLFRWFTFLIGGMIIASPLPDELGVGLLGFAHMKRSWFMAVSFTFNAIGILIIGAIARAL